MKKEARIICDLKEHLNEIYSKLMELKAESELNGDEYMVTFYSGRAESIEDIEAWLFEWHKKK